MLAGSVANLWMGHVGNDRRDLRSSRRCIVPSGKVPEEVL